MSYFKYFPSITYRFNPTDRTKKVVTNLLVSPKILDLMPERSSKAYNDYQISDGEQPEHVAYKVYDSSLLHWIVLLSNQIIYPFYDWPMSTAELQSHIEVNYPGIAIFFACSGETNFYLNGSSSTLPPEKSQFIVGNAVYQTQGSVTISGTIKEWDPTLRKLVVTDITEGYTFLLTSDVYSDNADETTFSATPLKIVYQNYDSVHHFVDDFGNYLDPYGKINYFEYDDNKVYTTKNIFYQNNDGIPASSTPTSTNDFILNKYISGNSQNNVVTCRQYEHEVNDSKRKIKILKIEYVNSIVQQLPELFST